MDEESNPFKSAAMPRPDVLHDQQLLRDLAIVNARTTQELGPRPVGGLPVAAERKPNLPRPMTPKRVSTSHEHEETDMNLQQIVATAVLAAGMVACEPTERTAAAAETEHRVSGSTPPATRVKSLPADITASGNAKGDSTQTPEQRLQAVLKPNMAYAEFRSLALSQGWEPLVNPNCKRNMVGTNDPIAFCAQNPDLTSCKLCDELPELSAASNDLYSLMQFRHPDTEEILAATGWGEIAYWHETGKDRVFVLKHWEFTKMPAQ